MTNPPLSMATVGLYSSRLRLGDTVLTNGDLDLALAFDLAFALALPNADGSTLRVYTTGVTGVERALTRRLSILILPLPLEGIGAEDP